MDIRQFDRPTTGPNRRAPIQLITTSATVEHPVVVTPLGDPAGAVHPQRMFPAGPGPQGDIATVQVNIVGGGSTARPEHDAPVALGGLVAHLGQGGDEQGVPHRAPPVLHHRAPIGEAHGDRLRCHCQRPRPAQQHPQRMKLRLHPQRRPSQRHRHDHDHQGQGQHMRPVSDRAQHRMSSRFSANSRNAASAEREKKPRFSPGQWGGTNHGRSSGEQRERSHGTPPGKRPTRNGRDTPPAGEGEPTRPRHAQGRVAAKRTLVRGAVGSAPPEWHSPKNTSKPANPSGKTRSGVGKGTAWGGTRRQWESRAPRSGAWRQGGRKRQGGSDRWEPPPARRDGRNSQGRAKRQTLLVLVSVSMRVFCPPTPATRTTKPAAGGGATKRGARGATTAQAQPGAPAERRERRAAPESAPPREGPLPKDRRARRERAAPRDARRLSWLRNVGGDQR